MAHKTKNVQVLTITQQLDSLIKSACDIMRKDKGLNGELHSGGLQPFFDRPPDSFRKISFGHTSTRIKLPSGVPAVVSTRMSLSDVALAKADEPIPLKMCLETPSAHVGFPHRHSPS